jgi:hypothetical protein
MNISPTQRILMKTFTPSAVVVAAMPSQCTHLPHSWEITQTKSYCASHVSSGGMIGSARIMHASFPRNQKVINNRADVVIKFGGMRFSWAWGNTSNIHILWLVTNVEW